MSGVTSQWNTNIVFLQTNCGGEEGFFSFFHRNANDRDRNGAIKMLSRLSEAPSCRGSIGGRGVDIEGGRQVWAAKEFTQITLINEGKQHITTCMRTNAFHKHDVMIDSHKLLNYIEHRTVNKSPQLPHSSLPSRKAHSSLTTT